jgi:hypothetical protein
MAIPTAYTDLTLAQYMMDALEGVASALEWSTASFSEQIHDVLLAYGAASVPTATDIPKLRTLAAYYAWRKAYYAGSHRWFDNSVSITAGGTDRRNQQQIWEHVQAAYREAEAAASAYLLALGVSGQASGNVATVGRIAYINDPYRVDAEVSDG